MCSPPPWPSAQGAEAQGGSKGVPMCRGSLVAEASTIELRVDANAATSVQAPTSQSPSMQVPSLIPPSVSLAYSLYGEEPT